MGLTDPNIIFSCTKNELDAIREGLYYRAIEERENLVELAFNLRYTLNAKKADFGKLSKKKDREKVRRLFRQREERESFKVCSRRSSVLMNISEIDR